MRLFSAGVCSGVLVSHGLGLSPANDFQVWNLLCWTHSRHRALSWQSLSHLADAAVILGRGLLAGPDRELRFGTYLALAPLRLKELFFKAAELSVEDGGVLMIALLPAVDRLMLRTIEFVV